MSLSDAEREDARLAALGRYALMDTPAEDDFDDLTRLAAQICETPVALITLLDDKRQWFKSRVGVDLTQTPRDIAFCRYALDSPDLLLVPDLTQDARFEYNPLVTDSPHARFYAGAPLVTPDDCVLGTLCVVDFSPRRLTDAQCQALQTLSRQAMAQMELRRRLADECQARDALRSAQQQLRAVIDSAPLILFALDRNGVFTLSEGKGLDALGFQPAEVVGQSVWSLYQDERQLLGVIRDVLEGHSRASMQEVGGGGIRVPIHSAARRRRRGDGSHGRGPGCHRAPSG